MLLLQTYLNNTFMYEHRKQKLAPMKTFYQRVFKNILIALLIMCVCLLLGLLGYHYSADIGWLDSLHNASMILSGMGPVVTINTVSGKWFSSFYALFSGISFITFVGVLFAPVYHRFLHKFHLDIEKK